MKPRWMNCASAVLLLELGIPAQLAAQHTQYKLIDLGTFVRRWT
jgi:hypothetical protein